MDNPEDITANMAAAMGFSSFGTQKPNKRRKFNASDNAVATTGSNMIPLGARKRNMDEIDLENDGDENEDRVVPTGQVVTERRAKTDFDEDSRSPYLDTSHRPATIVPGPADDFQSKIDAIIGGSANVQTSTSPSYSVTGGEQSSQDDHGRRYHNTNPDGRAVTKWWDNYYDPTSIINPWDALEKSNGLAPRGHWMSWDEAKAARP
ncbi:hypothetical protein F4861DRAFT_482008 [Xylaria intraflava]|nr:hypothetical protein F4861DRAFT_482008 [Xylaria intraflava]